jgi:hypothetical protein
MKLRSVLAASLGGLALVAAGSSSAFAGEITGNGNPPGGDGLGSQHAASICAFSGQNDTPNAPGPEGGRTQNYGQLVAHGYLPPGVHGVPGTACNPTRSSGEG